MSELISSRVDAGVGHIELNRPRVINSLNLEMLQAITELIVAWQTDDEVRAVELTGVGDRGFSAGADVKELAALLAAGDDWLVFLRTEYELNAMVRHSVKPVTSLMHGVTMGGGLGLASSAARRIVTHSTYMAMPETKIGLFPDAGMMFHLARAGTVGTHVALTSAPFSGGDALRMDIADESADGPLPAPLMDAAGDWIDECYASDDPSEIIQALERHSHPDAHTAARELRARSPFSVHVALRALRQAASLDIDEVLRQDLHVAERMVPIDFAEGVRALLIDKDNTPEWRHASIEDVPVALVDDVFVV
ncbi:MAG: enoyl-CoA hydratase/isomerase family protein [Propionibacteriaceae bacterium]|nr:enoyl-CoA hydratase/isomerase family protein [Propionibacteriaceae bacterium]